MKHGMSLGLAFLMMWSTACLDPGAGGRGDATDPARAREPFHVAAFDHVPTEHEIAADFEQFLVATHGDAAISSLAPTTNSTPGAGQKLVRIDATTSDITNAGTDDPTVSFIGIWEDNDSEQYTETFLLNKANHNDLERNKTDIYYYLLDVGDYISGLLKDRFVKGQISNTGTDGWHCEGVVLLEKNHAGSLRSQSMPFDQWVDSPAVVVSSWIDATNNAPLTY